MLNQHEIEIRVRYQETDGQGRVHHANYFTYFEQGRTELLRAAGYDYRRFEAEGFMLVVHDIACTYHQPAAFDDVLRLRTTTTSARGARVEHRYEVFRDEVLLAEGHSVLACVNRAGRVVRLPTFLTQQSAAQT
jgi:acyl-CoA thioester hydrolase